MLQEIGFLLLGFVLGHIPGWLDRRRKLKTHWCAIRAEMEMCKERAEIFLRDKTQSPLYRFPIVAFETSYPILLAEGAVTETEVLILGRFSSHVQDINRGLDYAAEMYQAKDFKMLKREYGRNRLKLKTLVSGKKGRESLYKPAKELVDSKIRLGLWRY